MFSKILGKITAGRSGEDREYRELVHAISKMDLSGMREYVNGRVPDLKTSEDGITEIIKKIVDVNDKTSKRYLQADDMDSKIKKCFELVISISESKHITVTAIEKIQEFMDVYAEIIEKYDKYNKDIYASRIKKSLSKAINRVNAMVEIRNKMNVTHQ